MEEDRGGETSSPFWSRGRPRRTISGDSNVSTSSSVPGAAAAVLRPWVLVLLLAVVVVLFVPSYVSTSLRRMRPDGGLLIKNWWDALNFVLVLFAVMCGFLGRNQEPAAEAAAERPVHSGSASSVVHDWVADYSADFGRQGFNGAVAVGGDEPAMRMRRLKRNSSSYPDLREETWASVDGWRFTDDFQLYNHHRSRRSEGIRAWEETPRDTDFKTIHVDSFDARSRSPPTPPTPPVVSFPPEEEQRWRSPPQKPRVKEAERNRGFDGSEIVEKARAPPPPPPPLPPSTPPRRSFEKLTRRDLGQKTPSTRFHGLANVRSSQPMQSSPPPAATPPPPPPPPPPPAPPMREQSPNQRRRSGGAKEIKIALAQFYQKRKKKSDKDRWSSDDPALSPPSSSPPTATAPPPPPPPPPRLSSGFFQRFSNKKGGSKSKRVHSVPAPPPPPPPPPTHSRKHASRPPMPPSTRSSTQRLDSILFRPPPLPPPPPPLPCPSYQDRRSSSTDPPEKSTSISDAAANKTQTEDPKGKPQTSSFCPSPDVNTKADVFIARLHAGWKLEKLNSIREKQQ